MLFHLKKVNADVMLLNVAWKIKSLGFRATDRGTQCVEEEAIRFFFLPLFL